MKKTYINTLLLMIFASLLGLVAYHYKESSHKNETESHPGNASKYDIENISVEENSPLKGKRILFLGSSVTLGARSLNTSMADYLSAKTGCIVTKEAVSGTTLVDNGDDSYYERLLRLDTNQKYDLVVVQLSTNDATKKMPLGAINDSDNYDTSTVIGALEAIISYAKNTWNCPIVLYTGTKYDDEYYANMVAAVPALKDKWNIGVIDLWNDVDMNSVSESDYKLYMFDPIHPTKAGYMMWWLPKFEEGIIENIDKSRRKTMKNLNHKEYMQMAVDEAYEGIKNKDGGPFGTVIVKDGKVIGKGHNRVLLNQDATCHGEMEAIRDASKNINSFDLSGAILYTTAAPCPMCKGAILWSNIDTVYYGCNIDDTDKIGFRDEVFYDKWNDSDDDNYGEEVEREACLKLFEDYSKNEHEMY